MTDLHPITPPTHLVERWRAAASNIPASYSSDPGGRRDYIDYIVAQASQWGADQELEACCEWLDSQHHSTTWSSRIRAARRKPLIKADQALAVLSTAPKAGTPTVTLDIDQFDTILLALGRMKEMEKPNE